MTTGFVLRRTPTFDAELKRLNATPEAIAKAVREELKTTATDIRNHIIRSMTNTPKSGRSYTKKSGLIHISSSPGNAPARDSSELARSIKKEVRPNEVEVGSNIEGYPRWLEEGTLNRKDGTVKMEPRPWLEPAVIFGKGKFALTIRKHVLNAIKKA